MAGRRFGVALSRSLIVIPISRQLPLKPQGESSRGSAMTITKEDEVELPQTRWTVLKAPETVALSAAAALTPASSTASLPDDLISAIISPSLSISVGPCLSWS